MTRRRWLFGIAACAALLTALTAWIRFGPLPDDLLSEADSASSIVLDRHGAALYEARTALNRALGGVR